MGVTPEASLPVAVRDDEDTVVAEGLFVGPEAAAQLGRGAEGGEEVGGDAESHGRLRRLAGLGEAHVRAGVGGNFPVALRLGLEVEVVGRGDAAAAVLARGAIDAVQEVAVGVGRRAQPVLIEDAEHRGVGADAEPERDDGDEGEAGRAAERLGGETQVAEEGNRAHERRSFMAFSSARV